MIGERWTYTLLMIIATVVAGVCLRFQQSSLKLSGIEKLGLAIFGLAGALMAAKLPFVVQADHNTAGLGIWFEDGKTVLWGLVGGYAGVELGKWAFRIRQSTGDSFAIAIPLAIAIGRLGCLLFGCCYGTVTTLPWGIRFVQAPDGGSLPRHPTQVYEILFHLVAAGLMALARRYQIQTNRLMPWYIVAYAIYRFFSEYIRPEAITWGGMTFYQMSAIPIAITFMIIAYSKRPRMAMNEALTSTSPPPPANNQDTTRHR